MGQANVICQVSHVQIRIPVKKLRRLFQGNERLQPGILRKLYQKKNEIEKNVFILQHSLSVIETILNRE